MAEVENDAENREERSRDWCITMWLDPDQEPVVARELYDYICWAHEICEETNRPHVHVFVQFKDRRRFGFVKALFGEDSHCEARRGTPTEARTYALKEDFLVHEDGVFRADAQGHRSDLEDAAALVKDKGLSAVAEEMPAVFIRNYKGLAMLENITRRPGFLPRKRVQWFFGPTGCGKTRLALEEGADSVYVVTIPSERTSKLWFDGYCGQTTVVLDDFCGQVDFRYMLRLLDKYSMLVEIKGSMVFFAPNVVTLTSDRPPEQAYPGLNTEERAQWMRRIDVILRFG